MSDEGSREGRIIAGVVRLGFIVIVVGIWIASAIGFGDGGTMSSSSNRVAWERYDVTIVVREDGTLHVVERQDVRFNGTFSEGFAVIPLNRVESISNVQVRTEEAPEDVDGNTVLSSEEVARRGEMIESREVSASEYAGEPGTHHATVRNGEIEIEYGFESTRPESVYIVTPQVRTIVLEYDVLGAIRDYPDAAEPWQQVHWMAISSEVTDIADIERATVTITLPEDVPVEELAYGPGVESVAGTRLTWPARSMTQGDAYDVQVAFPAITDATAPAWQPAADERDASAEDAENRRALAGVLLIGAAILAIVGGGLGLLYTWHTRIREPLASPAPDILSQPPGDLAAALVGALIDEEVQPRDVAALIMDLDRRGVIRISENTATDGQQFGRRSRYTIELLQPVEKAQPHEQAVLRRVFRQDASPGATATFDDLRPLFGAYREEIQQAMDTELVRLGYYVELPEKSRATWQTVLKLFVGASLVVAVGILVVTRSWSWFALLPPVAALIIVWFGRRLTPTIARKTQAGAEVAANWRAFQRHLESVQWSTFSDQRNGQTDRYLPWIIAFGLDHQWLREMNSSGVSYVPSFASSPAGGWTWGSASSTSTSTRRADGTGTWSPATSSGPGSSWTGGSWDPGRWSDLQGASDSALGGIQGASSSFFSMLGDAMEALGSGSGSSGGSSGRSSFGGSSRSSGGRSRSSSGGGGRGFR